MRYAMILAVLALVGCSDAGTGPEPPQVDPTNVVVNGFGVVLVYDAERVNVNTSFTNDGPAGEWRFVLWAVMQDGAAPVIVRESDPLGAPADDSWANGLLAPTGGRDVTRVQVYSRTAGETAWRLTSDRTDVPPVTE